MAEKDGEEGGNATPTLEELQAELAKARDFAKRAADDVAGLKKKLKSYEGLNPDEAKEAVEARRKAEEEAAKARGDWESHEKKLRGLFEEEKKPLLSRAQKLEQALTKALRDAKLVEAISEEKGIAKALLPMLKEQVRVVERENGDFDVEVVDENGKPMFASSAGDPMSIRGLVQQYKANPEFAGMFLAPKASGAGSDPTVHQNRDGGAGPKTIRADDQKAFLDNLDKIAKGEVKVVMP